MPDISDLDQDAQRLRVEWRKANNYFATFARDFFTMKDNFREIYGDNGYGREWSFAHWLLVKVGLFEDQVARQLMLFARILDGQTRERLEAERNRAVAERRAEAEAARVAREQAAEARRQERRAREAQIAEARRQEAEERAEQQRQAQAERERREAERAAQAQQRRAEEVRAARSAAARRSAETRAARRLQQIALGNDNGNGNGAVAQPMPAQQDQSDRPLDELIAQIRDGRAKQARGKQLMAEGRLLWIEGVLEEAAALAAGRLRHPANPAFGQWLNDNDLHHQRNTCAALVRMGMNLRAARAVLMASDSTDIRRLSHQVPRAQCHGSHSPQMGRMEIGDQQSQPPVIIH